MFNAAGRIAIVGHGAVTPFGTGATTYLTRTGRFEEAVPEFSRLMALQEPNRDYVDRNIGIRIIRRGEATQRDLDPQNYFVQPEVTLKHDVTINGVTFKAGEKIRTKQKTRLPVSHAGLLPSGWDIQKEMGLEGPVFKKFSHLHWVMARMFAEGVVSTGVPWSVIDEDPEIPPEMRGVAGGPGMAPGEVIQEGMANPVLGEPIAKDQLARYLADNLAFWLAKWLRAKHASTRIGACDTGNCNIEDIIGRLRSGQLRFGAVATFESAVTIASIIGFHEQMALATDRSVARLNDHPSLISRPGLADRAGFIMAIGGAILFLMEMELAKKLAREKGLIIYGELLDCATGLGDVESFDPAAPTSGGKLSLKRAIAGWAKLDGITPEQAVQQIDLINGHGTSTPAGDVNGIECYEAAMVELKRDPRRPVMVTYAKGGPRIEAPSARQVGGIGTGHMLGGAATAAADENLRIHREGIVPPAVSGYSEVDPKILRARHLILTTQPTRADIRVAVANAQGFGDSNGDSITRAYREEDYSFGREIADGQTAGKAWRDEQIRLIQSGGKKIGEYLPPLRVRKSEGNKDNP